MNQARVRNLLLLLVALGSYCCLSANIVLADESAYEELNDILLIHQLEHPDSTNEAYGDMLAAYLESIKHKGKTTDLDLVQVLEDFVAMHRSVNRSRNLDFLCSHLTFSVFARTLQHVDARDLAVSEIRLVDRIAFQWVLKRARACQKHHPRLYEQFKATIPGHITYIIEVLMNSVIKGHAPSLELDRVRLNEDAELRSAASQELYSKFIRAKESIGGPQDVQNVYEAMRHLATNDDKELKNLDEEGEIRPTEVARLFKKYVFEPCQAYSDNAARIVFNQAILESIFLPETLSEELRRGEFDYYLDWSKQRLCSSLLEDADFFSGDLKIKYGWFRMLETKQDPDESSQETTESSDSE